MKIKRILILFFVSASLVSFSQTAKEQKLLDKMCEEACTEFENAGVTDNDTQEELQMKLGLALMPVISSNSKEIKSVFGLDMSDPNDARQMGEKMGAALVFKCDKFQALALKLAMKQQAEQNGSTEKKTTGGTKSSVSGAVQKIDCSDLCVVYFKTDGDETIRLYWMEKFNGSETLEKFSDTDKNRAFKISYKEMEIYQPKSKSYQTVKVITGIE